MIGYGVTRIDLLQRTAVEIFGSELGISVIWGQSNSPRMPRPFARLELLSGPTRAQVKHETRVITTESDYIIDVPTPPTAGTEQLIRVNGVPLRHTSADGETTISVTRPPQFPPACSATSWAPIPASPNTR